MKSAKDSLASLLVLAVAVFGYDSFAQTTAFTYQGRLADNGSVANGCYDLTFQLFDAVTNGNQASFILTNLNQTVSNGLFTLSLNFGPSAFLGQNLWLQIAARTNASAGAFTPLAPRQPVTSSPYAVFAGQAGNVISGIIANPSFFGTSNNTPLVLVVNNTPAMQLQPTTISPNVIVGYNGNSVGSGTVGATISGGGYSVSPNTASGNFSVVGGGYGNMATADHVVVAGGQQNIATNGGSAIGGGAHNYVGGGDATVSGGNSNTNNGYGGAIGGGVGNNIGSASYANGYETIGGGAGNNALTSYATVAGGNGNNASGVSATIGGGNTNIVDGNFATVPGGSANVASGDYSFAAGTKATAAHQGAFVWADSTGGGFSSTGPNQFLIRASGGVGIGKANPSTALDVNGTVTATAFNGTFTGNGAGLTNLPQSSQGNYITMSVSQTPNTSGQTNYFVPAGTVAQLVHAFCYQFNNDNTPPYVNSAITVVVSGQTARFQGTATGIVTGAGSSLPTVSGPATITLGYNSSNGPNSLSFCTIQTKLQNNLITLTPTSPNYSVPGGVLAQVLYAFCGYGTESQVWVRVSVNGQAANYFANSDGSVSNLPTVVGPAVISIINSNTDAFFTIQATTQ